MTNANRKNAKRRSEATAHPHHHLLPHQVPAHLAAAAPHRHRSHRQKRRKKVGLVEIESHRGKALTAATSHEVLNAWHEQHHICQYLK
jgi:hypothetical protein